MPAMLRTSKKAEKIAIAIKGLPMNYETKAAREEAKKRNIQLMWADMRRQR